MRALITVATAGDATHPLAPHKITRPVKALVAATGELAGGRPDYRVQAVAIDELGSLFEAFNRVVPS